MRDQQLMLAAGDQVTAVCTPTSQEDLRAPSSYMASYRPKNLPSFLSKRQKEILELIYRGHLSKEIAHLLHISIKTVEYHRGQLMQRLGAQTQADLVRRAIEQGIVADDRPSDSDPTGDISANGVPPHVSQS